MLSVNQYIPLESKLKGDDESIKATHQRKAAKCCKVCSKSDKRTLLRMVNVLERGESQPDDVHIRRRRELESKYERLDEDLLLGH